MDIIGQIVGTVFLFMIIAFAFDWMFYNKNLGITRAYTNFVLKFLAFVGKALVAFAIPIVRDWGDKILYVASYYLEKNKPKPPTPLAPAEQQNPPPPQPGAQQAPQEKPKHSSTNPYDEPPEPEIMD